MNRLNFSCGNTDDRSYRTYWPYMFTLDNSAAGEIAGKTGWVKFQLINLG